ncbi:MAG TPA: lipoyl(octanoyl) transferase LipB [Actinomycetota bacterium]|nr:lipoyl(octanoyl) transferase LipB [Actinomycetota bacterium]
MKTLTVVVAGTVGYGPALRWQSELSRRRVAGESGDVMLLLEHPHVYTLGRRFSAEHLLLSRETLAQRGIEVFECDRGGSITYHGPGQLVGYPVLELEDPDVIAYLRSLEEVLIRAVRSFGIAADRREKLTGVWCGEEKLASIGVNVSRGVTKHGFALNVTTDLSYFAGMVPCGIPAVQVTSLERLLGSAPPMEAVQGAVVAELATILGATVRHRTPSELGLELGQDLDPGPAAALGLPGVTMREEARILSFPRNPGTPGGRVGTIDGQR